MKESFFILETSRVTRFAAALADADVRFELEKDKFDAAAKTNFAYAVEWHAHHVLRAQATWELRLEVANEHGEIGLSEVSHWLWSALNRLQHARDGESGSTSSLTNIKERIYQSVTLQYIGMLIG